MRRAEDQAGTTFQPAADPGHDCETRPTAASMQRRRTGTPFDDRIAALYHQNERLVRENAVLKAALVLVARDDDSQT